MKAFFLEALVVGGAGTVLALDRTAFLQTMASRPLVSCAILGAILGNVELGLRCGLMLELLWLMDLPVGACVPPDDTVASVLAVTFAAATPMVWSVAARSGLGVLAALPFGVLGRYVDVVVRRQNGGLVRRARSGGEGASLARLHLTGALRFTVAAGALVAAGAFVGGAVIRWGTPSLPVGVQAGLELSAALLPLVGTAAVLAALPGRRFAVLFGAGFLGGMLGAGVTRFAVEGNDPWRR